jgi:hypothetical protein
MKYSVIRAFSVLSLLIPALAQQTATVNRDAQALVILTKALAVATTQNVVSLPQDSVAQGTISFVNGTSATIKIEHKGFRNLRQDIVFPDHQISYVTKGGQGYSLREGKKTGLPLWVTQFHYPEHIPAISQMADFLLPNMNISYLGQVKVNGLPAYHIMFTIVPTDGTPTDVVAQISEFHVFVDVQTFLVTKTQSYVFSPEAIENRSPAEMYYSDYRSINGLLVPFQISRYISGEKYCDITFNTVTTNVGLTDADFQ